MITELKSESSSTLKTHDKKASNSNSFNLPLLSILDKDKNSTLLNSPSNPIQGIESQSSQPIPFLSLNPSLPLASSQPSCTVSNILPVNLPMSKVVPKIISPSIIKDSSSLTSIVVRSKIDLDTSLLLNPVWKVFESKPQVNRVNSKTTAIISNATTTSSTCNSYPSSPFLIQVFLPKTPSLEGGTCHIHDSGFIFWLPKAWYLNCCPWKELIGRLDVNQGEAVYDRGKGILSVTLWYK